LNAPQRPAQPPQRDNLLFLASLKTLLTLTEGIPTVGINVLDQLFRWPLFQVIIYGRFARFPSEKHSPG
jgi:hypothetical protein